MSNSELYKHSAKLYGITSNIIFNCGMSFQGLDGNDGRDGSIGQKGEPGPGGRSGSKGEPGSRGADGMIFISHADDIIIQIQLQLITRNLII